MRNQLFSILKRIALLTLMVLAIAPVSAFAQRRWHRTRVVISQPYVVYQTRPRYRTYTYRNYSYGYPQSYYSSYYANGYGYTEPYYSSPFYAYRYTQPYFANRYTYSWANPTYRYYENRRRRHSRFRVGVYLR